jgi:hypothetical protein
MPAVADYIIITDAQFRVDGSAHSFAIPPVQPGTKSILMFRMHLRQTPGASLWSQDLIVQINRTEVLKLWVPPPLHLGASTIHEVISEDPGEIYRQRANTISFRAVANPALPSGSPPLPDLMVSDVVLWFQFQTN